MKTALIALILVISGSSTAQATPAGRQACLASMGGKARFIEYVKASADVVDVNFAKITEAVEERAVRAGQIAGHLYFNRGANRNPYLIAAFPEGNTGISLFMKCEGGTLKSTSELKAVAGPNGFHGTEITIEASSSRVEITDYNLGSMRVSRDMELGLKAPKEVQDIDIQIENGALVMRRRSLNDLVDYAQQIIPSSGTVITKAGDSYVLTSAKQVQFTVQALTTEKPLTPLKPHEIFTPEALAKIPAKKLETLMFLLTREKFMAGSPRYLSRFGRDSIYTTFVLFDLMRPEAIEAILNGTISGMNASTGQVSHEQHEGDFASYERLKAGHPVKGVNTPIEDYKMIDTEPATVTLLGKYIEKYPNRVDAFLNGRDLGGRPRGQLIAKLFDYVLNSAEPFRRDPVFSNLIRLQKGESTGNWRDSDDGLGGGVIPFDVNVAFIPGALRSLDRIYSNPETQLRSPDLAARARASFEVWNSKALPLFLTRVTPPEAIAMGEAHMREINRPSHSGGLPPSHDLVFPVLSLDAQGRQVRVMNSDDSLMMVFGEPSVEFLRTVSDRILINFPFGLGTPVGTLIANAAFAPPEVRKKFMDISDANGKIRERYHAYTWKMQEDMYIAGLARQLKRSDLPEDLRGKMIQAQRAIRHKMNTRKLFMNPDRQTNITRDEADRSAGVYIFAQRQFRSPEEVRRILTLSKEAGPAKPKDDGGGVEVVTIKYGTDRWNMTPFAGDAIGNEIQLWSYLDLALEP